MNLQELVRPDLVFPRLEAADQAGVLREMAERVVAAGAVGDADELYERLQERERVGSTAMGGGVAIPHCKVPSLDRVVMAIGVVPDGIELDAPDEEVVRLFFLVLSPAAAPGEHLKCLAAISKWIRDGENVKRMRNVESREDICRFLESEVAP